MGRWPFLVCFLGACGSEVQDGRDASADATTNDAAPEAETETEAAVAADVVVDHVTVVLTEGGPFLCTGCICNGADHECLEIVHEPAPIVDGGFDDAATCGEASVTSGCIPTPADCLPTPTCDCALAHAPFGPWYCNCWLDPSDSGIVLWCIEP